MTLGEFGSTLNDELNRLANGGTYRDKDQMVDEALAAKQWANRENINPYSTDTVGILNEIAGLGLDKRNWLDFNGVCNYIAGTTGLPAAAALRQVYNTTDLLTSQSAYYVDATAPTNWGSLGYVRLNGVIGNYLSVPDSAALDITGDIDIRVKVAMDDWTPGATSMLLAKEQTTSSRSYKLQVGNAGSLLLLWSEDGTTLLSATSTVVTGLADGSTKWVRGTLDVDNGASGRDINFYTSDDGTTWTQLGDTVTQAGTTSIYSSTSQVEVGTRFAGTLDGLAGNFYNAQVLDGIGGTTVLDVNIATDYKASNEDTFTATTGQTVTVNGVDTIANLGAAGSLLPTTLGSSTAADSNDPKFLAHTGTNYVYLPGVAGNRLSIPDAANLDTTDLDFRIRISLDSPTTTGNYASRLVSDPNRAWLFGYTGGTTAARMSLAWYPTGSAASAISVGGTVGYENSYTAGQSHWARVTLDVDNDAGGYEVKFFTAPDSTTVPTSWTQVGTTITGGTTTSLPNITSGIDISQSTAFLGKVFRAQLMDGIDGTAIVDIDTSIITSGAATSFFALSGQTVTINRSTSGRKTVAVTQPTWLFGTDDYMEVNNRYMASGTYLYLPGVASNYASTPDAAALDITGDIDIRVKVAMDDWTPSALSALVTKWHTVTSTSYALYLRTDGKLALIASSNGTLAVDNTSASASTVATGLADGATKWVRATLDVDNGSGGRTYRYYLSDDGTNWTQLGTDVVIGGGTIAIFNSTAVLAVGQEFTQYPSRGKFFRAQVLDGIDGTVAFDANFETSITSLNQTSFTESSANAATVTINRSGSAYRSAGITAAGYLYPGATNTFAASATDFLNFGAADSFTFLAVHRKWDTAENGAVITNRSTVTGTITPGYYIGVTTASGGINRTYAGISGRTVSLAAGLDAGTGWTNGVLNTHVATVNRSTNILSLSKNAGTAATTSISTITDSSTNFDPIRIGAPSPSGSSYAAMELVAAAVFRQALTTSQIRQISNYFANREVYL